MLFLVCNISYAEIYKYTFDNGEVDFSHVYVDTNSEEFQNTTQEQAQQYYREHGKAMLGWYFNEGWFTREVK